MYKIIVKSSAILFLITIAIYTFSGCNNHGFEEVVSVTYTVNGKTKTEYAFAYISLGTPEEITEEMYEIADDKYKISDSSSKITQRLTPYSTTVTNIDGLDNSDKGKYIYITELWIFHGGSIIIKERSCLIFVIITYKLKLWTMTPLL